MSRDELQRANRKAYRALHGADRCAAANVVRPQPSRLPVDVLFESEPIDICGNTANVTTVLLRGKRCSFRCTMCDLWMTTHLGQTPRGNLPAQIQTALSRPDPRVAATGRHLMGAHSQTLDQTLQRIQLLRALITSTPKI